MKRSNTSIRRGGPIWAAVLIATALGSAAEATAPKSRPVAVEEASISALQSAIRSRKTTCTAIVESYLARIKAYNGTCVSQPNGLLGRISTIPNAGQLNAFQTLNLRPAARIARGFDERKMRSVTDPIDDDPFMPDALETAAALDAHFARTGKLVGPLHCATFAIKDQFDTFDMRTTSSADVPFADDRAPDDATIVARIRAAGGIILGKANMGEFASGDRSSYGGTTCNPYDTERSAGRSSGGSGAAVAANLSTCALGEETGPSARNPAANNAIVGLPPTQELISRDGLIPASLLNDRPGILCKTVGEVATVLDVIGGYDEKDVLTAFSKDRKARSYARSAVVKSIPKPLAGMKIGVVREYMVPWTAADDESIAITEEAIETLESLGATIVDPGPGSDLFRDVVEEIYPYLETEPFVAAYPDLFAGRSVIDRLVELFFDRSLFPTGVAAPDIRGFLTNNTSGEGKYTLNRYLRERGDAAIDDVGDILATASFWEDPFVFNEPRPRIASTAAQSNFLPRNRFQRRFVTQQIVMAKFAKEGFDAVVYPTKSVPAPKLTNPTEPVVDGRSPLAFTFLPSQGFPALSVPAGFTTVVYDRVRATPEDTVGVLTGPIPAALPVNIDFLGIPFSEETLFKIAAAYESATRARVAPPAFGPLR
jgi:amidase